MLPFDKPGETIPPPDDFYEIDSEWTSVKLSNEEQNLIRIIRQSRMLQQEKEEEDVHYQVSHAHIVSVKDRRPLRNIVRRWVVDLLFYSEKRCDDLGFYAAIEPECNPDKIMGDTVFRRNIRYWAPSQLAPITGILESMSNFLRDICGQLVPYLKRFPKRWRDFSEYY